MTKHIHGGDVYKHKDCLDFSANLNPLGTPESVKQAIIHSLDHIAQYPQVGCGVLRERIAESEGVKAEEVICGNRCGKCIRRRDRPHALYGYRRGAADVFVQGYQYHGFHAWI